MLIKKFSRSPCNPLKNRTVRTTGQHLQPSQKADHRWHAWVTVAYSGGLLDCFTVSFSKRSNHKLTVHKLTVV